MLRFSPLKEIVKDQRVSSTKYIGIILLIVGRDLNEGCELSVGSGIEQAEAV